jgi:thymidylate kinase
MFSVALIGPDGAGKTTVARRLEDSLDVPAKYMYMGVNPDASNYISPLSRLVQRIKRASGDKTDTAGPRDPEAVRPPPKGLIRRSLKFVRSWVGLAIRVLDEWFRQVIAWYHQLRGRVVIFDRHYFPDFYAYDIKPDQKKRTLASRVHGFLLAHCFPKPDLVICLDASGETLFARKGEGTIELLERRRRDYLEMRHVVKDFSVVDASQEMDTVVQQVAACILDYHRRQGPQRDSDNSPRTNRNPHQDDTRSQDDSARSDQASAR